MTPFSNENKKARILVVDDMGLSRMTAVKLLRELGFGNVEQAIHGDDAWQKIEKAHQGGKPFELVLTDWMMPVLDGMGLLKKLNDARAEMAVPKVILVTAESDAKQVAEAVKAGIAAYIRKPLQSKPLQDALVRASLGKAE